jgi:hypothetical protein
MAAVNNIVLTTEAEALEKILSPFIREQFPSFMQTDYRKLVLFIKAYYEWMEQKGNPGYVLSKLDTIWDSDRSLDEFYSHFKNTYLVSFPELFAVNAAGKTPNKNLLLKKIRDFYGNKGTESAYKFLFRLLYDSDLEFYYPKNDILKASDGVWIEPRSVKTTSSNGTALFGGKSGQLVQYNGSVLVASAFIDTVIQYSFNGLPVTEFFITDINGEFLPNLEVRIQKDSSEWREVAYSVLGDFFVQLAGSGYRVGDAVTVTASGTGFAAQVEQTGLAGSVKRISISKSGFNYAGDVIVNIFKENGEQSSAVVIAKKTAVTNYPGYFSGNRGKLSSNKKIQDGHYYQEFSYELKSDVSIDTYFGVLKSIVHPAGMRMFGSILVQKSLDNTLTSSDQGTFFEIPLIGRYTPYRVGTTLDLRANGVTTTGYWLGVTGDLYPLGYNPYIGSTSEVGPNGKTTSVGTVFVGTSLGYTYCYVPEGGRTSHNPIGAPLGSTSAWFRQKENAWTPQGLNGLVLWLKPENIGVCGSVVNGASMDVWRDASPSRNDAVPPTWDRWTDVALYAGVTIDKLRPTLVINDNGIVGATGISFDGGVIFGPQTLVRGSGLTLGSATIGFTFAPGSSGDKLLVGRHFYLKNGLTLSADMDMFIVYRSTIDSFGYGLGFVSSNRRFTDSFFYSNPDDFVVFSRSWNYADRDTPSQTSTYYNFANNQKLYPVGAGLIGFTPWRPFASFVAASAQTSIAYDPHVSGHSMGMVVGEVSRDSANVLYAFANGDQATNRSPSTGLFVTNSNASGAERPAPVCGVTVDIGRFGAYHRFDLVSSGTIGSAAWIATALTNGPYGFRGVLNEVIVFNRKLQETERQEVYGYLARKYSMDTKLPNSYTRSHPSAYSVGLTYWNIEHHPNTKGITGLSAGISFGSIALQNFFTLPDRIYKSKGTILADYTVQTTDTYTDVGL